VNAAVALDAPDQIRDRGTSVVVKLLDIWIGLFEDYRRRERDEIIEQEASESKLEEFREELKWLLRSAAHLHGLAMDPDYPAPQYAEEIAWRVRQLEDSWRSLNNPMTSAEAEAHLKKHFLGDPLLAKLVPE
jgi:hypothetical protein